MMFPPMTEYTERVRFELENQQRQREAELRAQYHVETPSLLRRLFDLFNRPVREPRPVQTLTDKRSTAV